jgi:saccharopine dehydrogenase-like NADP-dependent oxidoreductase
MRFLLHELRLANRRGVVQELLAEAYPPVRDDLVVFYAAAEGARGGRSAREEFVRLYRPRTVAGRVHTAIAWTTAAGAVAMVELLARGALPEAGLVRQEDVSLDAFLATSAGQLLVDGSRASVSNEAQVAS